MVETREDDLLMTGLQDLDSAASGRETLRKETEELLGYVAFAGRVDVISKFGRDRVG